MSSKIVVKGPVVELDGDEMTRIIWKKIKEEVGLVFFVVSCSSSLPVLASSYCPTLNSISSTMTLALRIAMQCVGIYCLMLFY